MGPAQKKQSSTTGTVTTVAPQQLKRLPRPRARFDSQAEGLMALYRKYEQELFISAFDPDAVLDERDQYRALDAQAQALRVQLARIEDARFVLSSRIWVSEMLVYQRLRSAARTNPDLAREVAPYEAYMKIGRRKKPTAPAKPAVAK